jgi:hypothetical protein
VVAEGHEHNEPGVTRDPRIDLLFAESRDEEPAAGTAPIPMQKGLRPKQEDGLAWYPKPLERRGRTPAESFPALRLASEQRNRSRCVRTPRFDTEANGLSVDLGVGEQAENRPYSGKRLPEVDELSVPR